jgi:hypothetical protein
MNMKQLLKVHVSDTISVRQSQCGGIALAALLMLAGCASPPPVPHAALQSAEQAISHAEQARVGEYAATELAEARTKLTAAHSAAHDREMVLARRLAEQSQLMAELAVARAEAAKAKEVNDEIEESIEAMKQEMERDTGGWP